ncbi:ARM repeat-containing protein [Nemania abortiva]|nr:ARM repeat-containing protein [Nemania abortiva]
MSENSDGGPPADSTGDFQQRRNEEQRKLGLHQVYPSPDDDPIETEIDIVAIHGLDTHSPRTWVAWKNPNSDEVHWLRDKEMLPSVTKNARIFTYDWNANYDDDSPSSTLLGHADGLLESLRIQRKKDKGKDPIVFIASCFGGLLLIKALHRVQERREWKPILLLTAGIAFLGTPFQGSNETFYDATQIRIAIAESMGGEASDEMVKYLRNTDGERGELDEVVHHFCELIEQDDYKFTMFCFYETHVTDFTKVIGKLPEGFVRKLKGKPTGILVPQHSACLQSSVRFALNVRHSMLNKYASPEDQNFKILSSRIEMLVEGAPGVLQAKGIVGVRESDAWIRDYRYSKDSLKIERLSGNEVPMDQCYINLAIVEQSSRYVAQSETKSGQGHAQPSQFALATRLKVETPDKKRQVELAKIFDPLGESGGNPTLPRRILIRGQAGVGKTTLCKKMVHDFIHRHLWESLFDRILWMPLQTLKGRPDKGYTLEGLFLRDFFFDTPKREKLAKELESTLHDSKYARTLFILDGLDEVSEGLYDDGDLYKFLKFLLTRPNAIITCRPFAKLPDYLCPDCELETIGFYSDQVTAYLETVFQDPQKVEQITLYLQKHRLIHSLIRIPIQLDAFCLLWDGSLGNERADPKTMTSIYIAIEQCLWVKDARQLGKLTGGRAENVEWDDIKDRIDPELKLLECLAFNGIYHNVVEFPQKYRAVILQHVRPRTGNITLNELLNKFSFLRSSDSSTKSPDRSYHFLHLTYQEFFAAKYFVQHWRDGKELKYYTDKSETIQTKTSPIKFLQTFKYVARYDMVWRFSAGLLGGEVSHFFEAIEKSPIDLIGPAHQRLVMHCLSETYSPELPKNRPSLEKRLSQWLLFELKLTGRSGLVLESEFPDGALQIALSQSTCEQRLDILHSFRYPGRYLSKEIITYLEKFIDTGTDERSTSAAIQALGGQSNLPDQTVTHLIQLLGDLNPDTFGATIACAIGNQSKLSENAVSKLLSPQNPRPRLFTPIALENQLNLSEEAINFLVEIIQKSSIPSYNSRSLTVDDHRSEKAATKALGKQSRLSENNMEILVTLIKYASADTLTGLCATEILKEQSNLPERIATALVKLAQTRRNPRPADRALVPLENRKYLAEATVNALIPLLKTSDWHVREMVARVLADQSNLPKEAKTSIEILTRSSNVSIQYTATKALKQQSNSPEKTAKALIQLLKGDDIDLRQHASRALYEQSNLDNITTDLIALLTNKDEMIRFNARGVLEARRNLPEQGRAILIQLLQDSNSELRSHATKILIEQRNLSVKNVEALVGLLGNEDQAIRIEATKILGEQSPLPKGTATALAEIAKYALRTGQSIILHGLESEEVLSISSIAYLTQLLEKGRDYGRRVAARILGRQSELPEDTLTVVETVLKDKTSEGQGHAAMALGKQSKISDKISTALVSLLKDPQAYVEFIVMQRSNWPNNVIKALVPLLADADRKVRLNASKVLAKQSKLPVDIAVSIMTLFENDIRDVQYRVTEAITNQGILMDKILESLEPFLGSEGSVGGQFALQTNNKRRRINRSNGSRKALQFIRCLHKSFLIRGFKEQIWMQTNEDSSLSFHRSDESRPIRFNLQSSNDVLKWKEFCNSPDEINIGRVIK